MCLELERRCDNLILIFRVHKNLSSKLLVCQVYKRQNHPNWKGGITPENALIRSSVEYKEWRNAVFVRDDFTCVKCGQKGGALIADHIKAFSLYTDLRLVVDNGRTLCRECNYESTYILKEWKDS